MKQIVVDIAELKVSNEPQAELITYSLGSCIGVAIWDPVVHVGGLLHYMLSDSTRSPDKATEHVGDAISRTMRLHIGTGQVSVENRKMGRIAV